MRPILTPTTLLLRASWQGWFNSLKRVREAQRKLLLKSVGYLIFIGALSLLGTSLFGHLRLTGASPAVVFRVINGFMIFGVIIVARDLMESSLKFLYEAPDSALLRAMPIPPIAIFGFKFVHLTTSRFLSLFCFLGTPWVAFGLMFQLPWHFYVAFVPACACFLVLIASHVTICMMVVARFFSTGGLLAALKVLGTVIGVALGFLLSLTLFFQFEAVSVKQFLLDWASAGNANTEPAAWYPYQWMGQLMFSWVTGAGLKWGTLLLGGSLGSAGIATLIAMQIYARGWENIRQSTPKRNSARRGTSATSRFLIGRGKMRAMMGKDFVVFIKHSGRFIGIAMLTLFLALHLGISLTQGNTGDTKDAVVIGVQILLYSTLITFGLSCNGFREEAKTWWLLKTAPVTPELAWTSKFLTALLFAIFYAEVCLLIAMMLLRTPSGAWISLLLIPILTLAPVTAVNTAIGTLPWMAELTDAREPLLRFLTYMLAIFIDMVLVIAPMIAWHFAGVAWFVGIMVLCLGGFGIAYRVGVANLRKLLSAQD